MATSTTKQQYAPKTMDVDVNFTNLTFEGRGGWYRANKTISSIFNRDDISFVQIRSWIGTNMPIIAQIDGTNVQFISPSVPSSDGYVRVRGIIL